MGIDMDFKFSFKKEWCLSCARSRACLICKFWEVGRATIFGTVYLVSTW